MVELVYKFDEKSYCECLSRSLKYDSNIFFIYIYIITDHFTPLALRNRGNYQLERYTRVTTYHTPHAKNLQCSILHCNTVNISMFGFSLGQNHLV